MYQSTTSASQYSSLSTEHANAITPSTWLVNLYIFKPNEDTSLPSKLELLFLLERGASICFKLTHLYNLSPSIFKVFKTFSYKAEFKTLTVANKIEVPILYNVIRTLHTSHHGSTRTLVIPFAVANIKYSILGTPFLKSTLKPLILKICLLHITLLM